jgi:hypothetical protein
MAFNLEKLFTCQFSPDKGPPIFGQNGPLPNVTLAKLQTNKKVTIGVH